VEREIKRLERARIEKKIFEDQKRKGLNNLKGIKSIDDVIEEENYKTWNFSIEKKTYKDTIQNLNKDEKFNSQQSKAEFFNTLRKTKLSKHLNEPLLSIEVKIDGTQQIEKLDIYPNDDPVNIANEFCKKFSISFFII